MAYAETLLREVVDLVRFVNKEEEKWDFLDPLDMKEKLVKELTFSSPYDLFEYLQEEVK